MIREVVEEFGPPPTEFDAQQAAAAEAAVAVPTPKLTILACAARDAADETALEMFQRVLDPEVCHTEIVTTDRLVSEIVALVAAERPSIVCIASLPPGGLAHTRLLCKRLRNRFCTLKIVVGRWGLKSHLEQNREQLMSAGADQIATSLHETCTQLVQLAHFLRSQRSQPAEAGVSAVAVAR
jgi:hypothetical protein